MKKYKLLFVCHGNICRSPMCEFIMKELVRQAGREDEFEIDSKACRTDEIGSDTHSGTKGKLREMGIPFTRHAARLIRRDDYDAYDYIVAMDDENMRDLRCLMHDDPEHKCRMLHMRSQRVVLALGKKQEALWDTIYDTFGGIAKEPDPKEGEDIMKHLRPFGNMRNEPHAKSHGVRSSGRCFNDLTTGFLQPNAYKQLASGLSGSTGRRTRLRVR